ncbi:hypothetical protein FBU31_000745 [Coemansia sp. 'formosensis']|nr:hypothetical protein FBU31_000745 [Coemansia sp. 'formosensis']
MDPLTVAIYKRLTGSNELHPVLVDVKDTGGGCGQMFTVTIVSEAFRDMRPLQRHRKVNEILENEIRELHAITLLLFSVSQYQAKNPKWVLPANATKGNDSVATTSKGGGDQSTTAVDKVSPLPLPDNAQAKNPKCASPANATKGDGSVATTSKDGGDQSTAAADKVSPPLVSNKSQAETIQI